MGVPGTTTTRADSQPPGELRLGRRGERTRFFVANVTPLDPTNAVARVSQRVETVADDAVDTLDASLEKDLEQLVGEVRATRLDLPLSRCGSSLAPGQGDSHIKEGNSPSPVWLDPAGSHTESPHMAISRPSEAL